MLSKLIWHVLGLASAGGILYGAYIAWGQLPAWLKGTDFNDLRIVLALVICVAGLSLGEAVWSRLPKRPKEGISGGKASSTDH